MYKYCINGSCIRVFNCGNTATLDVTTLTPDSRGPEPEMEKHWQVTDIWPRRWRPVRERLCFSLSEAGRLNQTYSEVFSLSKRLHFSCSLVNVFAFLQWVQVELSKSDSASVLLFASSVLGSLTVFKGGRDERLPLPAGSIAPWLFLSHWRTFKGRFF